MSLSRSAPQSGSDSLLSLCVIVEGWTALQSDRRVNTQPLSFLFYLGDSDTMRRKEGMRRERVPGESRGRNGGDCRVQVSCEAVPCSRLAGTAAAGSATQPRTPYAVRRPERAVPHKPASPALSHMHTYGVAALGCFGWQFNTRGHGTGSPTISLSYFFPFFRGEAEIPSPGPPFSSS